MENCVIKIDGKIIDFSYFYVFNKIGNYKIEYSFKQNLTKTNNMFSHCALLTNLNLSNFNTKNVNNMRNMFEDCSSLKNVNLSNFNTQNVSEMNFMFKGCSSLTNLDLSSFNTENVISMIFMFKGCSSLTSLDLSSFNVQNDYGMMMSVMHGMFNQCSSLDNIITNDIRIFIKNLKEKMSLNHYYLSKIVCLLFFQKSLTMTDFNNIFYSI